MNPRLALAPSRRQLLDLPRIASPKSCKFGRCSTRRLLSSSSSQSVGNPYTVLGVPVNSDYETVKHAFLRAAMEHHPDQHARDDVAAATDRFVRIRKAFEEIVIDKPDDDNGDDAPDSWKTDPDLAPYFRVTNEFLTFNMDSKTRKEVIHVFRTMSHGGKDKGGYWDMARLIAEREAAAPSDLEKPARQLTTGKATLNRRRRKR